jgi:hypothetical protein
MSALPPKADMCSALAMSALGQKRTHAPHQNVLLFDHLIGGIQEPFRNRQAECLGGFEIDHELRLHLIRFHGVLAPNAKLRSKIVPAPAERAAAPPTDHASAQEETPRRMSWARLLKRVFDVDVE